MGAFESGSEAIIMDSVANAGLCAVVPLHAAQRDDGVHRYGWSTVVSPRMFQAGLVREITPSLAPPAARAAAR